MRSSRPLRALPAALLVVTLALATACGAGAEPAAGDPVLRIVNSYEIVSLDPAEGGAQWMFDFGVSEAALAVDEAVELQPWLARSVTRRDDLTWDVELTPDVTFHNGKPLDGDAFAAAVNRQIELSANARQLAGAVAGATGPTSAQIVTATPNANVDRALAERGAFPVYDAAAVEAAGGDEQALVTAGFYTGPYVVTAWTPATLDLSRNDTHRDGPPPLAGVEVDVVPDEQARTLAVQSGEADIALYPPLESQTVLAGRDDAFFAASELALQSVLMPLNTLRPPFDDPAVRRAFGLTLDYAALGQATRGIFDTATGLYPTGVPYAVANAATDLAQANTVLDAAGWVRGPDGVRTKGGAPLTVVLIALAQGPETQTLAVAIQDQAAAAGFAVQIQVAEDQAASIEDPDGWSASLQLSGTLSGTGDPIEPFARTFAPDGDRNNGGIDDPRLAGIAAALPLAPDIAARDALLAEAQDIVVAQQAYVLVPAFKRFLAVVGPEYRGYTVSNVRRHVTTDTRPG